MDLPMSCFFTTLLSTCSQCGFWQFWRFSFFSSMNFQKLYTMEKSSSVLVKTLRQTNRKMFLRLRPLLNMNRCMGGYGNKWEEILLFQSICHTYGKQCRPHVSFHKIIVQWDYLDETLQGSHFDLETNQERKMSDHDVNYIKKLLGWCSGVCVVLGVAKWPKTIYMSYCQCKATIYSLCMG